MGQGWGFTCAVLLAALVFAETPPKVLSIRLHESSEVSSTLLASDPAFRTSAIASGFSFVQVSIPKVKADKKLGKKKGAESLWAAGPKSSDDEWVTDDDDTSQDSAVGEKILRRKSSIRRSIRSGNPSSKAWHRTNTAKLKSHRQALEKLKTGKLVVPSPVSAAGSSTPDSTDDPERQEGRGTFSGNSDDWGDAESDGNARGNTNRTKTLSRHERRRKTLKRREPKTGAPLNIDTSGGITNPEDGGSTDAVTIPPSAVLGSVQRRGRGMRIPVPPPVPLRTRTPRLGDLSSGPAVSGAIAGQSGSSGSGSRLMRRKSESHEKFLEDSGAGTGSIAPQGGNYSDSDDEGPPSRPATPPTGPSYSEKMGWS